MKKLCVFLVLLLFHLKAISQFTVPETNHHISDQIFINIGLEPELVTTIGYVHLLKHGKNGNDFYLGGSLKAASLILKNGACRFNLIQGISFPVSSKWKSLLSNQFYLAHNQNRAGSLTGLGFELRGTIITCHNKWNKGIEGGWQYTALTHIKHSSATGETYNDRYPGDSVIEKPVDGWYAATSSRFRLGFILNKRLSTAMRVQFSIGSLLVIQKQKVALGFPYAQVPVYINTKLSYGW
jgi:hypothetical protein